MTHNTREGIEKLLPCIDPQCDNHGTTITVNSDGEPEQMQCEYCYRERFPIIEFHHQELQKARESERELIWLPIQTAPKDGTHILVTNGRLCTVAHYFEGDTGGGWYLSWNEFACSADYQMNTITHWQALTPPTRL